MSKSKTRMNRLKTPLDESEGAHKAIARAARRLKILGGLSLLWLILIGTFYFMPVPANGTDALKNFHEDLVRATPWIVKIAGFLVLLSVTLSVAEILHYRNKLNDRSVEP